MAFRQRKKGLAMWRKAMAFIFMLVSLYIVLLIGLYVFQRYMIYMPDRSQAFLNNDPVLSLETIDGLTLKSLFIEAKENTENKTIIVMFHGNAGHAGHRLDKAIPFIRAGYGAVIVGYRGYGGNAGKPSEKAFYSDAESLMGTLIEKGHAPENIILYGESLGTGVASYIAANYAIKGMVLETPYTSLANVAQGHYPIFPVKHLMKDRFDTLGRLKQITAPILFMHGTKDKVIPIHHSQDLYDAYQGAKQIKIFEGGTHNNLFDYGAADVSLNFIQGLNQ